MNWDFSKLPKKDYEKAKIALDERDVSTLLLLHNTHKLSDNIYCCSSDIDVAIIRWFTWGLKTLNI